MGIENQFTTSTPASTQPNIWKLRAGPSVDALIMAESTITDSSAARRSEMPGFGRPGGTDQAPDKQQSQHRRHGREGAIAFLAHAREDDQSEDRGERELAQRIARAGRGFRTRQRGGIADRERLEADENQKQECEIGDLRQPRHRRSARSGYVEGGAVIHHGRPHIRCSSGRRRRRSCPRRDRACTKVRRGAPGAARTRAAAPDRGRSRPRS